MIQPQSPRAGAATVAATAETLDVVTAVLGHWGAWQRRAVFLIYLCKIPSAWFMACIIFTAPTPRPGEFFCRSENGTSRFAAAAAAAAEQSVWNRSLSPYAEPSLELNVDYCQRYDDHNGTGIPCESFEHGLDFNSLVTEFDLVCSKTILIAVTQFFHLFGVLTGGYLATRLLQIQSPRYVMLFGMITQIVCGCITGLTNQFEIHVFFRYLSAVCCAQMYTAGQMIFTDITGGKHRSAVVCLFETFWSIGVIVLPLLALIGPDWSDLYLLISLPTIGYAVLWFLIPDSPRWLLRNGRADQAKQVLLHAMDYNGTRGVVVLDDDLDERLAKEVAVIVKMPAEPVSWWAIWKGPRAALKVVAVHVAWAIYVTNYNGMLLNVKAFGRDFLSLNTIIFGVCEIVGVLIGLALIFKAERKWMWAGLFNIAAGLLSYTGFWLPESLTENQTTIILMAVASFAKMAVSISQSMLFTCSGEMVTPEKRPIFLFSCVVWARIWLLSAPFIGALVGFHQSLPLAAFGTLSLLGGVMTAIIPRPTPGS